MLSSPERENCMSAKAFMIPQATNILLSWDSPLHYARKSREDDQTDPGARKCHYLSSSSELSLLLLALLGCPRRSRLPPKALLRSMAVL